MTLRHLHLAPGHRLDAVKRLDCPATDTGEADETAYAEAAVQAIGNSNCPTRDIADRTYRRHGLHLGAFGEAPRCRGKSVIAWTRGSVS
jgi:hypothetical protein